MPSGPSRRGARRRARGLPAEQQADLVAGETSVAARSADGVGDRDREAVGVGVVRDDELGADVAGPREAEVHRARLLGVRERDRRERRVGCDLLVDERRRVEPGRGEHARRGLPADAVHRRVDDASAARPVGRRRAAVRRTYSSTTDSGAVSKSPRGSSGTVVDRGDAEDVRGDLGVGGCDDLRPVVVAAEVHLVAVVVRRVVRRGHHDAGRRRRGAAPRTPARASAGAAAAAPRARRRPAMTSAVSRANTSEFLRPS